MPDQTNATAKGKTSKTIRLRQETHRSLKIRAAQLGKGINELGDDVVSEYLERGDEAKETQK